MENARQKQPSLFSAISIGICCMIGSGWLFASYNASKVAGSLSILSWIIGAVLALVIALMLAEISTMYHDRGLFSRLLSFSHHRDFGFVFAISNWLGIVLSISSEALATVQYLSTASPRLEPYLFNHDKLTFIGTGFVILLLVVYGLLNFWGMRSLAKTNNIMAVLKIGIPVLTAIFLMVAAFHPHNFTAYHHTIAPYGVGSAFTAVITCGIFYSFYGFSSIATFGAELKNPRRTIPIALISSVVICLIVYLLLQVSFIAALPTTMVEKGWHQLDFTSPLAQLLVLLNLNVWAIILYADAAVSPSGAGITYTGTATRMFTGMSRDEQMPKFFDHVHELFKLSRRSLIFTLIICTIMVMLSGNWQQVMMMTSVFYVLSCLAVPLALSKLRQTEADRERPFKMPFAQTLSLFLFLVLTYLLIQVNGKTVLAALILHVVLFAFYVISFYQHRLALSLKAFLSSWSIFAYLIFTTIFSYIHQAHALSALALTIFIIGTIVLYVCLLQQKCYNPTDPVMNRG